MFPDVRLMIGAIMASIVTLGCGFGVFAAFRVNHEPLSRLSNVSAPVSLVTDSAAPRVAPFPGGEARGSRFEMNDGVITGSITTTTTTAASAVEPQVAARPPLAPVDIAAPPQAQLAAVSSPPTTAAASSPSSAAPSGGTIEARADQSAVVQQQPATGPMPTSDAAAVAASVPPANAEATKVESTRPESANSEPAKLESATAAPDQPEATPPADQSRTITQASQAAPEQKQQPKAAPLVATDVAPADDDALVAAHKSIGREHLVTGVARRARRPRVAAVPPSAGYGFAGYSPVFPQANYQPTPSVIRSATPSSPSFFAKQPTAATSPRVPVLRRVVHRAAPAAPPKPSGVDGPLVGPPSY